ETVSYAQLETRANQAAHALRALGIGIGDTIALACENRPEFFDLYWATQRSGATMVPVSSRLKADEIAYIVQDSGSKLLLLGASLAGTAADLVRQRGTMPGLQHILAIGGIAGLPEWGELTGHQPA